MPNSPPRTYSCASSWRCTSNGNTGVEHRRPEPRRAVLASDFFVVVTATFRLLYVFVVLEVGTRRIVRWNVTDHPTADWTSQQFRMIVPGDQGTDS